MGLLDGRKIRDGILNDLKLRIRKEGLEPKLVIIVIGENKASKAYVSQKKKYGEQIGAKVFIENIAESVTQDELASLIKKLNRNSLVHGVILQLPVPYQLDQEDLTNLISPEKDVDGFVSGSKFKPATALGIIELLKRSGVSISGKKVVVIGRGKIAGKPVADLLREEGAKVEVVHSQTKNPKKITKTADILISAVGKPKLVTADMVKEGAVVVDVGISPIDETLVGDVDFQEVSKIASKISPVPGGVGPMTVAALLNNLVIAAESF